MKKINKRYKDHDVCSMIGIETILSNLDNYTSESLMHLKNIREECNKPNFNHENLFLPTILICDLSTDIVKNKLTLLKSSLDRYLFADEDFSPSSIKHANITKSKRTYPTNKFRTYNVSLENFPQKFEVQAPMEMMEQLEMDQ